METKVQQILNDLYKFDASLKEHESEIIKIIEEYMKVKPDTKFDEKFAMQLRDDLLKKAAESSIKPVMTEAAKVITFSWANKFTYALTGAACLILIFVVGLAVTIKPSQTSTNDASKVALDFGHGISKIAGQAFGKLSAGGNVLNSATGATSRMAKDSSTVSAPMGIGGGGGAVSGMSESTKIMPPFDQVNYEFVYKGDELKQEQSEMNVYKRVKAELAGKDLGRLVTNLKTNLIDLKKFSGSSVSNINLTDDKEYGYMVTMDFVNSNISIYQNWQKWPRPDRNCKDDACFNSFRIKYENVPSDDSTIAIADDFLKQYGIDMSGYGKPSVMNYWRKEYERAQDKTAVYIPEEMTVSYPLVIENLTVYDESGNPSGLSVGVNIMQNKVSSVNVIATQKFESSAYAAVTDNKKIMDMVKRGGVYGYYQASEGGKKVEVELGTPTIGLMRYYSYNNDTQNSDELFVPCYVFPVINVSDKSVYYDRQNIVIPLAEDILSQFNQTVDPIPMPLSKPVSDAPTEPAAVSPDSTVTSDAAASGVGAQPNSGQANPPAPATNARGAEEGIKAY